MLLTAEACFIPLILRGNSLYSWYQEYEHPLAGTQCPLHLASLCIHIVSSSIRVRSMAFPSQGDLQPLHSMPPPASSPQEGSPQVGDVQGLWLLQGLRLHGREGVKSHRLKSKDSPEDSHLNIWRQIPVPQGVKSLHYPNHSSLNVSQRICLQWQMCHWFSNWRKLIMDYICTYNCMIPTLNFLNLIAASGDIRGFPCSWKYTLKYLWVKFATASHMVP